MNIYEIYTFCFLFGFFQSAHVLNFAIASDVNVKKHSATAIGFTNMAVMLGGAILQPFIGLLLNWNAHGSQIGQQVFSRESYHIAFTTIIASQIVALLIAIFLLPDKRTKG